jgi:hypothetical protein
VPLLLSGRLVPGVGYCWLMAQRTPLDPMLWEIERAVGAGFYYLAVSACLSLPAVCAALEQADGRSERDDYKAWFDENLSAKLTFLTADDCYSFRCGVLHQGRFGDLQHSVQRVLFVPPGPGTFVNCKFNDAYVCSVVEFCRIMTESVRDWYHANAADPNVRANVERLVRLHPNGIAPYFHGVPVIG